MAAAAIDATSLAEYLAQRDRDFIQQYPGIPRWWLRYAFHFTDVNNAAGIITSGELLSRRLALSRGVMEVENADVSVIARSPELTETSARFYFRPKTPTQYHNEGHRPIAHRYSHNAHCPVPVFFLFPLDAVLTRPGCLFTNTAAYWDEVEVGKSIGELRRLQWQHIYSDGPMSASQKNAITGYRRAEILVPDSMPLDSVFRIVCRSAAERDTLLTLLDKDVRKEWRQKVELAGAFGRHMFQGNWLYMLTVTWTSEGLVFKFNPCAVSVDFHVTISAFSDGEVLRDTTVRWDFGKHSSILVRISEGHQRVNARVELDGALAYAATLNKLEMLV